MGANASNQTPVLVASIQKNTKHLFYNNQKLVFDYWRKLVFEVYETGPKSPLTAVSIQGFSRRPKQSQQAK
jgi:hypothetical protein